MKDIMKIPADQLGKGTNIKIEFFETTIDIYNDITRVMVDTVKKNNELNKNTVMILPVGPVFQYRRFARLVKLYDLDISKFHIFFMDEYIVSGNKLINETSPLSFRGFIKRELVNNLLPEYKFLKGNLNFPNPAKPDEYYKKMVDLGGVEYAIGGVGIQGHLAFNEAMSENKISKKLFAELPTRVLELNLETRVINSHTATKGNIDVIPKKAITVGMKEILSSKKIRLYIERDWQSAVLRKFLHGPITPECPASYIQNHPDAYVGILSSVAQIPYGALR